MIDPVNPQDKMVVGAVMTEKEDMLIYHCSRDVCTFALNHFRNLISLYQLLQLLFSSLEGIQNIFRFVPHRIYLRG